MLIVADDLTGAADCGVACTAAGLRASVLLGYDAEFDPAVTDVVSVDMDTRRMSAAESAAATEQVVREWMGTEQRLLYQKLDSTLRGNFATELKACLKVFRKVATSRIDGGRAFAVIAPAFPKMGRTTNGGRQFVNGIPLEETEIWHWEDLKGRADLSEMLRSSGVNAELLGLNVVRSGQEMLRYTLAEFGRTADAVVCDAETDEDLRAVAVASLELCPAVMWAGSAGLAHQLLQVAGFHKGKCAAQENGSYPEGPTLFVIGSPSSVSRAQADALRREGDVCSIPISPGALRGADRSDGWNTYERSISDAIRKRHDVLVHLDDEAAGIDLRYGRSLAAALAKVIEPYARSMGALVLTGGETAREVLDALGMRRLRLIGEVEPGLPFSVIEGWTRPLPVLTKAGAFGNPQSLVHCRQFLRSLHRRAVHLNPQTEPL